jgi:hypothetical protein
VLIVEDCLEKPLNSCALLGLSLSTGTRFALLRRDWSLITSWMMEVSQHTADRSRSGLLELILQLTMLALARQRVSSFEEEYQNFVEKLAQSEVNIQGAIDLRSRFIFNQEQTSLLETELFKKHVEVLEHHLELVQLNLIVDKYTMDGCYEELQLQQLISGTQQKNGRNLDTIMRGGSNQLIGHLQSSILLRQDLVAQSKLLASRLEALVKDHRAACDLKQSTLTNILAQLGHDLTNNNQKSALLLRKVIEESLVLRHNSRLAADMLSKRRFQEEARELEITSSLNQLQNYLEAELRNVEDSYQKELEIKLQHKRSEVMRLENVLENLLTRNTKMKLNSKETFDNYVNTKKSIDCNHEILQIRRREELVNWHAELEHLKKSILAAESIVLNPMKTYDHIPRTGIEKNVRTLNRGQSTDMQPRMKVSGKPHPRNSHGNIHNVALSDLQSRMKGLKQRFECYSVS